RSIMLTSWGDVFFPIESTFAIASPGLDLFRAREQRRSTWGGPGSLVEIGTVTGRFDDTALPIGASGLLSVASRWLLFPRTHCPPPTLRGRLDGESRFNASPGPLEHKAAAFASAALLEQVPGDDGQK